MPVRPETDIAIQNLLSGCCQEVAGFDHTGAAVFHFAGGGLDWSLPPVQQHSDKKLLKQIRRHLPDKFYTGRLTVDCHRGQANHWRFEQE